MGLQIKNLRKTFGENVAVNSLNLSVEKGEVLGLLGRNGAGKTTTIKMILGLLTPNKGEILWNGKPLEKCNLSIGYLPEERGLHSKTKIIEQLRFFGSLEGMTRKEVDKAIDYWFERLQIPDYRNKNANELSKGNQQKIQLVATLLHNPDFIILDEPFSGLDPVNATLFSEVIEDEVRKGKLVILSSHRMESVEGFCQKICILKAGDVVASGNLKDVKEEYGYQHLYMEFSSEIEEELMRIGIFFEKRLNEIIIRVHDEGEALILIQDLVGKRIVVKNFKVLEPTLHEIFVERAK